jgi:hypothetical protein
MAVPTWQAGTLYQTGDLVRPNAAGQIVQTPPTNASFEAGNLSGWVQSFEFGTGTFTALNSPPPDMAPNTGGFNGTWFAEFEADTGGSGTRGSVYGLLRNTFLAPVRPGQAINFSCKIARNGSPTAGRASIG